MDDVDDHACEGVSSRRVLKKCEDSGAQQTPRLSKKTRSEMAQINKRS
jgi:hypothetical protein